MKIAIFGTSNSLLRTGWVKGLNFALEGEQIDNFSIGASPGVQFGLKTNIELEAYDYIFFDSVPNDEEHFRWNLSSEEKIKKYLRCIEAILELLSNKTKLFIMMIPLKENFEKKSIIYKHRINFSKKIISNLLIVQK